jgi:hypothetical protein
MMVQDTVAIGGGDAGASSKGGAAATRKDATTGEGAVALTKRHAAPAGAAQDSKGDGGARTKNAAADAAHVILTVSPGNGATGRVTVSGARAAGHDAMATVAAAPAGGGAPESIGVAMANIGSAQPSARERHELGGGVVVGVVVGCGDCEEVGVSVDDGVAVGDGDGEHEGAATRPSAVQASAHRQGVGAVLLGAQKEPSGQSVHVVAPGVGEKEPPGHGAAFTEANGQKEPAGQMTGAPDAQK